MKTWKIIKTETEYKNALIRFGELINNVEPNTPGGDEFELLALLIENYEKQHFPVLPLDPIDAIMCSMEDMNISQKDLADLLGDKGNTSKVLKKKRKLSLEMIRKINEVLKIPIDILTKDYDLAL
ncbi:MAG: transcriptional regulator [Salinivirgaceae bacterium]|nr:transcriptional regulator [Salinivirgaceae bacterium]